MSGFSASADALGARYRLLELLGEGGMASVFKGQDLLLERVVAVKFLRDRWAADSEFVARFRQEARAAANLYHPNIVAIYDAGEDVGRHYIVMEYVEGRSLKEELAQRPLSPLRVVRIGIQICAGLHYAHQKGVVHGDVKPHNILLREDLAKITDFGIAQALNDSSHIKQGEILGSPPYLSPEQVNGQDATIASDIYSLGVLLYEAATGSLPFQAESPVATALKHIHEVPVAPCQRNAQVPPSLEAIILKAMAKEPEQRFRSAAEIGKALAHCIEHSQEETAAMTIDAARSSGQTPPKDFGSPHSSHFPIKKRRRVSVFGFGDPKTRERSYEGPGEAGTEEVTAEAYPDRRQAASLRGVGREFEEQVAAFFRRKGFIPRVTRAGPDSGVDIELFTKSFSKTRLHALVQCKDRPNGLVGRPELQKFVGAMQTYTPTVSAGYFVTSGRFTREAYSAAQQWQTNYKGRLELYDRERLTQEGFYSGPSSGRKPWRTPRFGGVSLLLLVALGVFATVIVRAFLPTSSVPSFPPGEIASPRPPRDQIEQALVERHRQWLRLPNADVVFSYRTAIAPSIDGSLDDWQGRIAYSIASPVFNQARWKGPSDLSGVFLTTWDSSNLYVAIKVIDDVFAQESQGSVLYKGDSVELQLDTRFQEDFQDRDWDEDDLQIGLSPGNFGTLRPEAYLWSTDGTTGRRISSARIASVRTSEGYTLEAAIPWPDLRVRPRDELIMGLCISLSDNDVPGTIQQESMVSHCINRQWHDPFSLGSLILVDKS